MHKQLLDFISIKESDLVHLYTMSHDNFVGLGLLLLKKWRRHLINVLTVAGVE